MTLPKFDKDRKYFVSRIIAPGESKRGGHKFVTARFIQVSSLLNRLPHTILP